MTLFLHRSPAQTYAQRESVMPNRCVFMSLFTGRNDEKVDFLNKLLSRRNIIATSTNFMSCTMCVVCTHGHRVCRNAFSMSAFRHIVHQRHSMCVDTVFSPEFKIYESHRCVTRIFHKWVQKRLRQLNEPLYMCGWHSSKLVFFHCLLLYFSWTWYRTLRACVLSAAAWTTVNWWRWILDMCCAERQRKWCYHNKKKREKAKYVTATIKSKQNGKKTAA